MFNTKTTNDAFSQKAPADDNKKMAQMTKFGVVSLIHVGQKIMRKGGNASIFPFATRFLRGQLLKSCLNSDSVVNS